LLAAGCWLMIDDADARCDGNDRILALTDSF
jgi:hypothetical protein